MALGTKLVRGLGLEPSVDTLGRWLAHHLAEVILAVENAEGVERDKAQNRAVDLILKVWSRRHDIPGRANPLKDLQNVVKVLRLLGGDAWPYAPASNPGAERLLKRAFEGLQHIVAHGAILASGVGGRRVEMAEAEGFLDKDEAHIVRAANAWLDLYSSLQRNTVGHLIWEDTADLESMEAELEELLRCDPETRARRVFVKQIDRLAETLTELKATFGQEGID